MPGTPVQAANKWLDWARWRREGGKLGQPNQPIMRVKGSDEPVWIDRNGTVFKLTEILDSHLRNIERWLLGRGAEDIPARKRLYDRGWYDIIRDELERRGLESLDDHKDAFDEKVTFRTGNQDAAYQARMREIILAERLLYRDAVDMGLGPYLDAEFNDTGLDGKPYELAGDDTAYWDGEHHPDLGRSW